MCRIVLGSIAVFLIGVIQVTASHRLSIWQAAPDLPLLLTVSLGLASGAIAGMAAGFGLALVQAGLSQEHLLSHALGLLVCGYLAGAASRRFFREHWLVPLGSVLLLTLVNELLFRAAAGSLPELEVRWLVVRSAYNTALAWPCLRVTTQVRKLAPARAG